MNTARRIVVLAVLALACAWTPAGVDARENETFGITPYPEQADGAERGKFSIPLEPGATFEDAVRVYNRTDQELDLLIYAADAEATLDDTDISAGFRTDEPKGVGAWIDLNRETIELQARDEVIVSFLVEVKDSEPNPDIGAIVVENTAAGSNASQREILAVTTEPPNTETTSTRVRPLLFRSPWIIVAVLGVVLVLALVLIGWRRARKPKDVLVPAGEIEQPQLEPEEVPEASRPVIKRLGASDEARTGVITRDRPLAENDFLVEVDPDDEDEDEDESFEDELDDEDEDENLEDENLEDEDEDEHFEDEDDDDLPPARRRPSASATKPAARKPAAKKPAARKAKSKTKPARPVKKAAARKKPAAKKKTPARKKPATRKAKPKAAPRKPPRGYIPLEEI